MRSLNYAQSKQYAAAKAWQMTYQGYPTLPERDSNFMVKAPRRALHVLLLASEIISWFDPGSDIVLWFSHAEHLLPDDAIFSEKAPNALFEFLLARGGERLRLQDTGSCIFAEHSEDDRFLASGMVFLMMSFAWRGFLVSDNYDAYVMLADRYLIVSHAKIEKIMEAAQLVHRLQLKIITDVKDAWDDQD